MAISKVDNIELIAQRHTPPTWRHEFGAMARLASPMVLTQLAWVAMLATDTAMIGRLGPDALAGATLSLMLFFMAYIFCFGVVMATASLASQAYGARNPRRVRRIIRQGWWITLAITGPALVAFTFTADILSLLGQPVETLPHANAYMSTLMWSLPPAIAFAVLRNFVSALGRPSPALWVMLMGAPLNALLDYGLIFGNFGFPRLELVGAGLATAIINFVLFFALLAIAILQQPFSRYAILGRFWRSDWAQFREIFRIGIPIAGIGLMESGFFIGAVFLVGHFGADIIAAHMIAMQMPHITFMVPMGLAQAATVRVGHAVGRGNSAAAYRAGWTALAMTLGFMAIMTIVVLSIPEQFASIFLDHSNPDSASVLALAVSFLFFAAFFQAADGVQVVAAGALRGLNDTLAPMIIAAISYWGVGFAVGIGLAFGAGMKAAGLWLGFIFSLSCAAILLTWRFRNFARAAYLPKISTLQ
ncbi:MAG: MATE family efflux transporter [Proteobacteria bacterium]|nr:MATE family efflux transporter [Pseudomonadota bacterium]MDA1324736.1 MATE family efflux transporter [Pseudomonadota bacterium]